MAGVHYNGTSAYKIEEYNAYTSEMHKKQEEKVQQQNLIKAVNRKKLIAVIGIAFVIAAAFLILNVMRMQAAAAYDQAVIELEDLKMRNAQLNFDIASGVDLAVVEARVKAEFGMQRPESYQNVYVNVVQNDYTETFSNKSAKKGVVEKMISSLKAFLAYVG